MEFITLHYILLNVSSTSSCFSVSEQEYVTGAAFITVKSRPI